MKHAIALAAAAGLASVLALPASAETNQRGEAGESLQHRSSPRVNRHLHHKRPAADVSTIPDRCELDRAG